MVNKKLSNKQTTAEDKDNQSFLPKRFKFVYGLVLLQAVLLLGMVVYLQVVDSDRLIKEANNRSLRTVDVPYTRGKILDRNGRALSISVPMHSVLIDPKEYFNTQIRRKKNQWRKLALETGTSAGKIEKAVSEFLKDANNKYDPRSILNTKSDDYWRLSA